MVVSSRRTEPSGYTCAYYDGVSNDLLTAGLGATGLAAPPPAPAFVDPNNPTAIELRRNAIYVNYRALIDTTASGGYGTFFGPAVGNEGQSLPNDGKIPGWECLGYGGPPSNGGNVTMMVQIPDGFDPARPCIVTGASSGSRGVYGAIGTSGDWGLKQRCAVAYTDKGTGTGAHDLQDNTVSVITGKREDAGVAGERVELHRADQRCRPDAFDAKWPNRFAFKHAHSTLNPEADWGEHVLNAVRFAFKVLNGPEVNLGVKFAAANTMVIASSVSNGAGAGIKALEEDTEGLIDGFAGTEPNVNPRIRAPLAIQQGNQPAYRHPGKPLYDYYTILNLYQGCANRAYPSGVLLNNVPPLLGDNVCASLRQKGLLRSDTLPEQAAEAQAAINAYGLLTEQNAIAPGFWALQGQQAIGATYANAYARAKVQQRLCDYSFAATDAAGKPVPPPVPTEMALFSNSNGIPPSTGMNLINDASCGGPLANLLSVSPSGVLDQNVDGALCLRSLWVGRSQYSRAALPGALGQAHRELRKGIEEILASGNLKQFPAIIATGRNDQVVAPNHGSRAYYGLNQQVEGWRSQLAYYEVLNAQHLDTLNGFAGYNELFIPLHVYFVQVMNIMYAHLHDGTPIPPSQVVRTVPRGPGAPPLTSANVPDIALAPPPGDRIVYEKGTVKVPE